MYGCVSTALQEGKPPSDVETASCVGGVCNSTCGLNGVYHHNIMQQSSGAMQGEWSLACGT